MSFSKSVFGKSKPGKRKISGKKTAGKKWQKAAQGKDGRLYPWGDTYKRNLCNSAESGNRRPVAIDQYPEGNSPYGCYQMVGNVFEWVDESHPTSDKYKYLCGGEFIEFDHKDIKVPENNIYAWFGYFDIE
jgi:formylglycine-generating enzyme required for sulfatase activity